ncbi:MAG: hydrogenase maturation nickel metallochaperone HypA [Phycisphaerae bacterium]|nr:hydrogenase maturation nickel metallochaperone HypA [Phycisphaerae bacterium]
MITEETLVKQIYQVMKHQLAHEKGRLRKVMIHYDSSADSIDPEKLNRLWKEIAVEPIFESSHIEVHSEAPGGCCLLCNQEFELDATTACCPFCHCEQFKIIHEPPVIETYEMDETVTP